MRFRRERSCSVEIPGSTRWSSTNRRGPRPDRARSAASTCRPRGPARGRQGTTGRTGVSWGEGRWGYRPPRTVVAAALGGDLTQHFGIAPCRFGDWTPVRRKRCVSFPKAGQKPPTNLQFEIRVHPDFRTCAQVLDPLRCVAEGFHSKVVPEPPNGTNENQEQHGRGHRAGCRTPPPAPREPAGAGARTCDAVLRSGVPRDLSGRGAGQQPLPASRLAPRAARRAPRRRSDRRRRRPRARRARRPPSGHPCSGCRSCGPRAPRTLARPCASRRSRASAGAGGLRPGGEPARVLRRLQLDDPEVLAEAAAAANLPLADAFEAATDETRDGAMVDDALGSSPAAPRSSPRSASGGSSSAARTA